MTDKVPPPKWGDYNSLGNLYAALGDPRRLEMLALLRERGPLSVGDIAQATELRQSNVSTKLAYLKFNRLVAADPQGRLVYYSLSAESRALLPHLDGLHQAWHEAAVHRAQGRPRTGEWGRYAPGAAADLRPEE